MNPILNPTYIFNPDGDDRKENRSIWFGDTTNLCNLNDVKYNWASGIYIQMRDNFWVPNKLDLTQDVTDYADLSVDERRAYDGLQSYLTYLDSIQTNNIPEFKRYVTAPEVQQLLTMHEFQESIHNQSYQYMIESIIPAERRNEIYEFWRTDPVLRDRCKYIASFYHRLRENPTVENYFYGLVADYLLEGLYFYVGFNFFYNLSNRNLMSGSADMFKYINKDELTHVRVFERLIPEAMETFKPYVSTDKIYEMTEEAITKELEWTNHILGDSILGMTPDTNEEYINYRANNLLNNIGLNMVFGGRTNPYKHLEKFSDTGAENNTKANFFEGTVTSYAQSSSVKGWDNF